MKCDAILGSLRIRIKKIAKLINLIDNGCLPLAKARQKKKAMVSNKLADQTSIVPRAWLSITIVGFA